MRNSMKRPIGTLALVLSAVLLACGAESAQPDGEPSSPSNVSASSGVPSSSPAAGTGAPSGSGAAPPTDATAGPEVGAAGAGADTGGIEEAVTTPDTGGAAGAAMEGSAPELDPTGGASECEAGFLALGTNAECAACACTTCATEAMALDNVDRALANSLIACGLDSCCAGQECYCANDLFGCTLAPAGPCVSETEAAAGAQGALGVQGPCSDPANACGAAYFLGRCLTGDPLSNPPAVGMCPACQQC